MSEKKVLGILAIVFGGIALLLSWVPNINTVANLFGIIGAILGIVGLVVNIKNKKTLAIIGTVLSIVSIVIVFVTQSAYSTIDTSSNILDSSTQKKANVLTVNDKDYSFSKNKDYTVDVSDDKWAGTKVKVDKVTIYKLVKKYKYKSASDGTFEVEGFVKLHFSISPSRDIEIYPTQGTAIFDNREQQGPAFSDAWDGEIAENVIKDGAVIIPVKSLKDVTALKNIRFKFDAYYDTDDDDDINASHDYDITLNLK